MDESAEEPLPIFEPADLAPGWEEEGSVLCIGGRTPLDEAAAAMLAGLLNKHGLKARVAVSETISARNIVSLDVAKAKLVCLSFLRIGNSSTQLRYLVRRLRRILPSGSIILVGFWTDDATGAPVKALKERAEADAYATSLRETAEIAANTARHPELELVAPLPTRCYGSKDEQARRGYFMQRDPAESPDSTLGGAGRFLDSGDGIPTRLHSTSRSLPVRRCPGMRRS